ncbi:MAG: hypothetical protein KDB37_02375 [Ilumatobacter sp.]|nr:hypothetical protein [Ilumatobacter sp.]
MSRVTITIASDRVSADVAVDDGGRLAQLTVDGVELLVDDASAPPTGWGAYPMVPWAGRIRHGRFSFDGVEYRLPINFDHHAIHGVGFVLPWDVDDGSGDHLDLRLDLPSDERWPFGGVATQRFRVDDLGLTTELTVLAGDRAFPVSFGWHPWFRKPERLDFRPTAMYRRHDGVAADDLVPPPPPPWDDCFVNHEPVGLRIDGVELELTSSCDHWVVYDERTYATCVEPQTGPPDAFNIAVRRLEPGASMSAWYRIAVEPPA